MSAEDWYDISEYNIMRCDCNQFTWYQDDTEDVPEACPLCGNVLLCDITCRSIGLTVQGESYFEIDEELVHEGEISLEIFESL